MRNKFWENYRRPPCLPSKTLKLHKTITFSPVLYGCQTWVLTTSEELSYKCQKIKLTQQALLEPESGKVSEQLGTLNNGKLCFLCSLSSIVAITNSRRTRRAGNVVRMTKRRFVILEWKSNFKIGGEWTTDQDRVQWRASSLVELNYQGRLF